MPKNFKILFALLILFGNTITNAQKAEHIALTPPMGWNSWNCFSEDISDEKIKSMADAMVSSDMKNAGYEYIVVDEGWMTKERDKEGHIIIDS
jgi:alpha-galactosidase